MFKFQQLLNDFKNYLSKKRLSKKSIKNYVSDVRRFLKWQQSIGQLDNWTIGQFTTYRSHLTNSKIPIKTVNRHLSSLRQFGSFLVATGLTTNNPAEGLESVKNLDSDPPELSLAAREKVLEQFKQSLEEQRLSKKTITNYISDVSQFLEFLNSRNL